MNKSREILNRKTCTDQLELERILKQISLRYFYAIIAIFTVFTVYYWYESIKPFKYIVLICFLINFCMAPIPYILDYKSFKPLISLYLIFISIMVYPQVLLFWRIGQITTFMWFFLIPFAATIFYSAKTIMYWCIYIFVLICSVFVVSPFLPETLVVKVESEQISVINILTIICFLAFFFYFLYYINIINDIKSSNTEEKNDINSMAENNNNMEEDIAKFNKLYENIDIYFKTKKPYCDPDFTISQLASTLNSNIAYIAKAIKMNRKMNFNVFINFYRIEKVKNMLDNDYHNKYTMRHIYVSAGFRHQSTFNKVFKQIIGITPSDYIRNIKSDQIQ